MTTRIHLVTKILDHGTVSAATHGGAGSAWIDATVRSVNTPAHPHWHTSTPPCEADADSNGNVLVAVYEIKNFQGPYKLELAHALPLPQGEVE